MDKIDMYSGNKTQRLNRCCSSYLMSKLIMDNQDFWGRKNPDSSEVTGYNRSFGKEPG